MSDKLKLTTSQQTAAIDNAAASMSLRSGAGCGKTFVLARRYTQLLLDYDGTDNPLTRYVALTFTEKAAIEMNVRVRKMLRQFADNAEGALRTRLLGHIDDLPEARISTIHSFCASLLRAHAVEAQIDPAFSVCADSLLINQLSQQSAQKAILDDLENNLPHARNALGYFNFNKLIELIVKLLQYRENWTAQEYQNPDEIYNNWLTSWKANKLAGLEKLSNDTKIRSQLEKLRGFTCGDPSDKLLVKRSDFLQLADVVLSDPHSVTLEQASQIVGIKTGNVGSTKAWGDKQTVKQVRDQISSLAKLFEKYIIFFNDIGEIEKPTAEVLCSLMQLAWQADKIFSAEKRSRGILDFADLVVYTHRLLEDNPKIRTQVASQIDQLLVDECQDTDAYQLSMLRWLFDDGNEQRSAFMVGDPKQSIYRFRGADVNVFEKLCAELGKGCSEILDVSFRTHDGGVEFVNELFADIMKPYEPTKAHRVKTWDAPSIEFVLADRKDALSSAEDCADVQAAVTAKRIRQMLDDQEQLVQDRSTGEMRPVRAGDIAVLFSRMTKSLNYEKYLQRLNIPYYVVGGSGFFQQQEIYDLLNVLAAIENPLDDIAFVGLLRGSLIGLDDNALMSISEALEGGPYYQKLKSIDLDNILPSQQINTVNKAIEIIDNLGPIKNTIGITEVLQQVIDITGYTSILMSQFNANRMVANVRQLLQLARNADREAVTLGDFISQVDTLTVEEERYEQAVVSGEADDVVRLMTVHKSKGLEFPVVIIPDLNIAEAGCTENDMLYRNEWGWTLNLHPPVDQADADNQKPLPFQAAKLEETNELKDENIRRLYVAATRHEDYLVFVGGNYRTKQGGINKGGSYLDLLDSKFRITEALDAGHTTIDYCGGKYQAILRKELADNLPASQTQNKLAREILKHAKDPVQLTQSLLGTAGKAQNTPPYAGIVPTEIGTIESAVTALGDFEHCPRLFQWRYELQTPTDGLADKPTTTAAAAQPSIIDPATLGTILHRCMELLDFCKPQDPQTLVTRTCREMQISDSAEISQITAQFQQMLDRLITHPLFESLKNAEKKYTELDFLLNVGQVSLKGQIDLLYRDADGGWHVVDYKSDRVEPSDIPAHSKRYELQMISYAMAASGRDGMKADDVMLYYLRTGETYRFEINDKMLCSTEQRIITLGKQIISARRKGHFETKRRDFCERCPYKKLCVNQ